ncbi:4'-phosphopantetheinyl transferase [Peniophora sp. CONT]|nr:4'-phosphopantetheinyl transferase [Peniophora sp. CONT]
MSPLFGIGIDILHVPRLRALASRRGPARLAARILSPPEHGLFAKLPESDAQTRFLAVRWAIKEAAYKAVYPAKRLTWKELVYQPLDALEGKPVLDILPMSDSRTPRLHASVSHDGDYVCAVVVAESLNQNTT